MGASPSRLESLSLESLPPGAGYVWSSTAPGLLPNHLAAVLWNFLFGSPTWGEQLRHASTLLVQGNIPLPQVTSEIVGSALDVTANSETPSSW